MKVPRQTWTYACLLILLVSANAAVAQVTVVSVNSTSGGPLSSTAPSNIGAVIQSTAAEASTLHVFIEEYPSGSGCGGDQHKTNGGRDFQVKAGPWSRQFIVPWFGGQLGTGFLRVGARLDRGEAAWSEVCLRFGG